MYDIIKSTLVLIFFFGLTIFGLSVIGYYVCNWELSLKNNTEVASSCTSCTVDYGDHSGKPDNTFKPSKLNHPGVV